ncbi:expressed unknown protein [Seminavis robusta]|uniref:Uncharacterized protein n=1 Tax=Seminavis robusta TaxID=568900 RepID=A0A9N8DPF1_9STRA|nr:expressed unknown protein [Seminavis robusta]|eukprot:Sro252_g099690.1 n/a (397) ;mRNA; f:76933-78123
MKRRNVFSKSETSATSTGKTPSAISKLNPLRRVRTDTITHNKQKSAAVNPLRRTKTVDPPSDSLTSSTCSTATTEDGILLYPEEFIMPSMSNNNTTTNKDEPPIPRRGGVLFKDNSQYQLQRVKFAQATKGILKVASLEDSLRSCLAKDKIDAKPRRASFNLLESQLSSSRNVFADAVQVARDTQKYADTSRGCISLSSGMDMDLASSSFNLPPTMTTGKSLLLDVTERTARDSFNSYDDEMDNNNNKKSVVFADIQTRLYPVAPDDNPSASGKGPAIALSGWKFKTIPDETVEEHEASRGHVRKTMEDLKLDMMERRKRLQEHGASQKEMAEFGRRAYKAKMQRLETVQAAKTYGKQYEARLERRADVGRFVQRALGLRKTDSQRINDLWDRAQQ